MFKQEAAVAVAANALAFSQQLITNLTQLN